MVQFNSIPQQILYYYQNGSLDQESFFRGVAEIEGVPSTIVVVLSDLALDFPFDTALPPSDFDTDPPPNTSFIPSYGQVIFNGEIRNPFERQIFNGDITQLRSGFVRFQDGNPGTLVKLDFSNNQIDATIGPFRPQTVTYSFQYEPTTQDYASQYLFALPPNFDAAQYGASHPDLITAIGFNLHQLIEHYLYAGQAEGRAVDTFDEIAYLAANPDLFSLGGYLPSKAVQHYIQSGFWENRSLSFDASAYLASNPDLIVPLQKDRSAATVHYVNQGYWEGRSLSQFDPLQYLASYSDLALAFGVNPRVALEHFVDSGHQEGRNPDVFDEFRYIASYPDLIQHFGLDGLGATLHYIVSGIAEQRNPLLFDPISYLNLNPDVNQAFGGDPLLATKHYIQSGFAEGRAIS